jgi:hypothetical protein
LAAPVTFVTVAFGVLARLAVVGQMKTLRMSLVNRSFALSLVIQEIA